MTIGGQPVLVPQAPGPSPIQLTLLTSTAADIGGFIAGVVAGLLLLLVLGGSRGRRLASGR
jgi:hypothetical protein